MTAITSPTVTQKFPNAGIKEVVVKCTASANYTWDATNYFTVIHGIDVRDATGLAIADAAFTLLSVDVGTVTTPGGVLFIRVWGV